MCRRPGLSSTTCLYRGGIGARSRRQRASKPPVRATVQRAREQAFPPVTSATTGPLHSGFIWFQPVVLPCARAARSLASQATRERLNLARLMQGVRAAAGGSEPDFWEASGRCGEGKQNLEGCRAAALPTLSLLVPFPLHSQAHVLDDAPLSAATATGVPK